jgi:hypothetical protein
MSDGSPYHFYISGGYNLIASNLSNGIESYDSSWPDFGGGHWNPPGYNNIINNIGWEVYTNHAFVSACYCWWGSQNPNFVELIYDTSQVLYGAWTESYNIRGDCLEGGGEQKPDKEPSPLDSLGGPGFGDPGQLIQSAFQLLYSGNPQQAAPLFQQIITNFQNLPVAAQALMGLYQCYQYMSNLQSFLPLLSNLITVITADTLREQATYLEAVVARTLGNSNLSLDLLQDLAQTATQANYVALAKFDVARIYTYDLDQPEVGDSLLETFIQQYPTGDLSILAQVELGLIDPPLPGTSGNGQPETVSTVTQAPLTYSLSSIYPNPFNAATAIRYQIPESGHVSLKVYDLAGRLVATVVDGWRMAGSHEATFDGSGLASGMYFVRMQAGTFEQTRKMVMVK